MKKRSEMSKSLRSSLLSKECSFALKILPGQDCGVLILPHSLVRVPKVRCLFRVILFNIVSFYLLFLLPDASE
jgi:hypothetical protein